MIPQRPEPTPPPPADPQPSRLPGLLLAGVLAAACVLTCVGALLLAWLWPDAPRRVTVLAADAAYQVETRAATVGALLDELGLALDDGDRITPPPDSPLTPDLIVRVEHVRLVTLMVDGQLQTLETLFTNPFDILKSAGLTLGPYDQIIVDGTPATLVDLLVWPVPATQIGIRRAVTVRIDDDGQRRDIHTTSATIGEALFEAGVTLYLADTVTPGLNSPISGDVAVTIRRSRPVTIVADGVTLETRSQGATVASALTDAGVTLQGLDYTIPDESSALRPGMLVRVIRVTEQVEVEQSVIAFETVYQPDANLELDQRLVIQEGQNGVRQTNIRIRYENGIEVSRQPENAIIAREPVNRVITYGTRIVLRTVDTPEGPREYWRKLRMYATIYYPAALGGNTATATGRRLTKGIVASNPQVIAYGTQLYVPGYGLGLMADTGAPPFRRLWIDLGYDDDNWEHWSRWTDVYLLTPVPEKINYLLPYSE